MKQLIIILVLIAIAAVEAQKNGGGGKGGQRKKKDDPDFLAWKNKFKAGSKEGKWAAKSSESLERRAARWAVKKQRCDEHNAKRGGSDWICGSTEFDHLESDEAKTRLCGTKPPMEARALPRAPVFNNFVPNNLPTNVDWTVYMPPIYHQGSCGSCWAFATLANIECWRRMRNFPVTSLSPQFLVDCDVGYGNNQCNGGWPLTAMNNLVLRLGGGVASWADYPYTSYYYNSTYTGYSPCKTTLTRYPLGYTSPYQVNVNGNENIMKYMVANYGAVTIAMWATTNFMSYRGGIFYDATCPVATATTPQCHGSNVNHAMVIVGYDTINGTAVWKVRNSWGTGWGIGGYAYVARNATNNCNFACFAFHPDI